MAILPTWEIAVYHVIALSLNLYFYIEGHNLSKYFVQFYNGEKYLDKGISWIGKYRDGTDYEWLYWKQFVVNDWPWIALHTALACTFRSVNVQLVPLLNVLVFVLYFCTNISVVVCAICLLEACFFYFLVSHTKSKLSVWFCGVFVLLLNSRISSILLLEGHAEFFADVSLAWLMLKLVDYSLRQVESDKPSSVLNLLGYAFYLPTYCFGPFIPYSDFAPNLYQPLRITVNSFVTLLKLWIKYAVYGLAIELVFHFAYFNVLALFPSILSGVAFWDLYGIAFCLAQIFYVKYLIMYGSLGALANFEGYKAPAPPKCVTRINLYSDMWRYFDRGYYDFMSRNIYKPLLGALSKSGLFSARQKYTEKANAAGEEKKVVVTLSQKMVASTICFCFVFLWHSLSQAIFYWSLLNYIGLSIEAIARFWFRGSKYGLRLKCFAQSPLWMLAMVSNTFFFCGYDFGILCLTNIYQRGLAFIALSWAEGYIMSHIANYWPITDT